MNFSPHTYRRAGKDTRAQHQFISGNKRKASEPSGSGSTAAESPKEIIEANINFAALEKGW